MKIPNTVRIAGVDYTVEFHERMIGNDGNRIIGKINYTQATVKIDKFGQDYQNQCKTFFHEVMHGVAEHFKLDLDEDVIDSIANGFYMVIMDNPEMFK